jgi:hypothetical protein
VIGLQILSSTLKSHPSFGPALELLVAQEAICEKIGKPVVKEGILDLVTGRIDLVGGTVSCSFTVEGPSGEATVEYTAMAIDSKQGTQRAEELQWVILTLNVKTANGPEYVVQNPSAAAEPAFAGKLGSEGRPIVAEKEETPLWGKMAVTGTAGLMIGGVASVFVNRFVRSKKPQAYWSAYDKMHNSPGVMRTCGKLEKEGEHKLVGRYDEKKADFHFMFAGSEAKGRASVRAHLDDKDVWRFSDISVDVPEMKRPIKVHKGE